MSPRSESRKDEESMGGGGVDRDTKAPLSRKFDETRDGEPFVIAKGYFGSDSLKGKSTSPSSAADQKGGATEESVDSKSGIKGYRDETRRGGKAVAEFDDEAATKKLQGTFASLAEVDSTELTAQLIGWCRHGKIAEVKYALSRVRPSGRIESSSSSSSSAYVDIDTRDSLGNTPLITCCQNGQEALCRLLISAGADLKAANNKGNTALHFCLAYGYQDISKLLIEGGADEFATNSYGLTPYEGLTTADLEKI